MRKILGAPHCLAEVQQLPLQYPVQAKSLRTRDCGYTLKMECGKAVCPILCAVAHALSHCASVSLLGWTTWGWSWLRVTPVNAGSIQGRGGQFRHSRSEFLPAGPSSSLVWVQRENGLFVRWRLGCGEAVGLGLYFVLYCILFIQRWLFCQLPGGLSCLGWTTCLYSISQCVT